jgi:hypothetical protein
MPEPLLSRPPRRPQNSRDTVDELIDAINWDGRLLQRAGGFVLASSKMRMPLSSQNAAGSGASQTQGLLVWL